MKSLLMIAALSLAAPAPQADKPASDSEQQTRTRENPPAQDQGAVSHRLRWDSNRQQVNPMRTSPAKEGAGPEIR
jgi:hypothetical protein